MYSDNKDLSAIEDEGARLKECVVYDESAGDISLSLEDDRWQAAASGNVIVCPTHIQRYTFVTPLVEEPAHPRERLSIDLFQPPLGVVSSMRMGRSWPMG